MRADPPVEERAPARVLVVDDDASVRELYARALRAAGFDALEAASGADALELLEAEDIAVILLDAVMPDLDGYGVLDRLRATSRGRGLPVIFVTGQGGMDDRVHGLTAGADDYLTKPVALDELVARVRSHVRARQDWVAEFGAQVAERRAVVEALRELPASASADEAAGELLDRLGTITRSAGMALFHLTPEVVICRASSGTLRARFAPGKPVSAATRQRLRRRAGEAVTVTLPSGSAGQTAGRVAHVQIPLADADSAPWGVLHVALETPAGPVARRAIARRLPALTEMADLVAVALRPRVRPSEEADAGRVALRHVIAERAFVPHLQPIVRMADSTVVAHELLTRFADGTPPAARFADARRLGMAAELEAATAAAGIEAARHVAGDTALFLNVSVGFLRDRGAIRRCLAGADRPVVLELSESEPVDDYGGLQRSLATLGPDVRLAVDDAGSGYASLRHILALRPAFVKLDLSWVRGIDVDEARQALVRGVCDFGTRLGCRIIAEGIETEAEQRTLMDIGVELGQGYLLGRPRPVGPATEG
jgi:EAL domain-containing protein (putative c-di-GMP-specific phosphodiesterase class I)/DNA-binding response OmpR family regulator